jgi:hypothetical protein
MVRFPRYLNSPIQVLWGEADSFGVFCGCLVMANTCHGWIFWLSCLVGPYLYGRVKKNYPRGLIKHLFYFFCLAGFEGYPGFHERRFRE